MDDDYTNLNESINLNGISRDERGNLFLSSLATILLVFYSLIWSMHVIALAYGRHLFGRGHMRNEAIELDENNIMPGVSILKPLKGVDDNLFENLRSYFQIDYPKYELIFCVQDSADPVIDIVRLLIAQHPIVDAKLFYGGKTVCENPKISNLCQGYPHVRYDLMLISDAGIKTTKDGLYNMVSLMKTDVGLVHQLPYCWDRPGRNNILEKMFFGGWQARNYLAINFFGLNCCVGMSCLMRKSLLDEYGGLVHFGKYVAEDFFIAKAFLDKNFKTVLSHEPAYQNSSDYSPAILRARVIRWTQLRVRMTVASWIEPLGDCFAQALYVSWSVCYLWDLSIAAIAIFIIVHVLLCFLNDYFQLQIIERGKFNESMVDCVSAWIYRETMCYVWFARGALNPYVKWRGALYKLKWGGSGVRVVAKKQRRKCWQFWKKRRQLHPENIGGYVLREIKIENSTSQQQRLGASNISTICPPCLYP